MTSQVQTAVTVAEVTPRPAAALQRACACGAAAGISGKCPSCAASAELGIQPKLGLSTPGDPYEQEADRIADQILSSESAAMEPSAPGASISRLQRQSDEDQEEESLQGKRSGGSPTLSASALSNAAAAASAGGQPLSRSERAWFEPRLGRDLSAVRVHPEADAARAIAARAYTHGNHIVFAPGQYDSRTTRGRRLLAHELVHALQQSDDPGAYNHLQRATEQTRDDAPDTPSSRDGMVPLEDVVISASATVSPEESPKTRASRRGNAFELEALPVYPGDVIILNVGRHIRDDDGKVIGQDQLHEIPDWTFPDGEMQPTGQRDEAARLLWVRVIGPPPTGDAPRMLSATIDSKQLAQPLVLRFHLTAPPASPDVIDPEQAEIEHQLDARKSLKQAYKEDRKRLRRSFRDERRSHRPDDTEPAAEPDARSFRSPAHKRRVTGREARKRYRERRGALKDRYEEGREALPSRRQLRKARRELNQGDNCTLEDQRMLQAALETGSSRVATALSRFSPDAEPSDRIRGALWAFFHVQASPQSRQQTRDTLQRITDVLSLARNTMLSIGHDNFRCSGEHCSEGTGAGVYVFQRGAEITICREWRNKLVTYAIERDKDAAQAFALLHELAHVSGAGAPPNPRHRLEGQPDTPELYVESDEWSDLAAAARLDMADAYAAFAWTVSRGGGTGNQKQPGQQGPRARKIARQASTVRATDDPSRRPDEVAAADATAILSRGGQPLTRSERTYFEPRLGQDLSSVRLHTDAAAGRAARGIDARAYAYRNHIAFATGQYDSQSAAGRRLLAHELVHTVQQGARGTSPSPMQEFPGRPLFPPAIQRSETDSRRTAAEDTSCGTAEGAAIREAMDQAKADLDTAAAVLDSGPSSAAVRDSLWLAFRLGDPEPQLVELLANDLRFTKRRLTQIDYICDHDTDPASACAKKPSWRAYAVGRSSRVGICFRSDRENSFESLSSVQRGLILIHEVRHVARGDDDRGGYFRRGAGCAESLVAEEGEATAGKPPETRFRSADNWACLVYYLAHLATGGAEPRQQLADRARALRGGNLKVRQESTRVDGAPRTIHLDEPEDTSWFELGGVPEASGFSFDWVLLTGMMDKEHPLRPFGGEVVQGKPSALVPESVRAELRAGFNPDIDGEGRVLCRVQLFDQAPRGAAGAPKTTEPPVVVAYLDVRLTTEGIE